MIPAEEVQAGDILRVLPGEAIPVDGVILEGQTSINQAVMTGESLPVDKTVGDEVFSGTVNQFGAFDMKATKVGEDSSIQRMVKLVQSVDAGKAKIVGIADRWATWIVVIALTAAALAWLISGQIIRAVTILVVFCPCALVLATPTAIMAAIGNATKHGFLVREGDALERLASVANITFDKTGTLTYGTPKVVASISVDSEWTDEDIYRLCTSAELRSEHSLGKAVVDCYKNEHSGDIHQPENFEMTPGQGVSANVDGKEILAGNKELFAVHQVALPDELSEKAEEYLQTGCTIIYMAIAGKAAGLLALSDTLREDAPDTIRQINDAPALKKAYVGIAMGGIGSDIAVDAADIALINDQIKELPHLLRLSKRMMITIKCNLTFSMTLNFIAIVLAITGILNPVIGALVHNAGSVLVIINSAFLLNWKK